MTTHALTIRITLDLAPDTVLSNEEIRLIAEAAQTVAAKTLAQLTNSPVNKCMPVLFNAAALERWAAREAQS